MLVDASRREPIDIIYAVTEADAIAEFIGSHSFKQISKAEVNLAEKTVMCFEFTPESDNDFERYIEEGEFVLATYLYEKTRFYKIFSPRLH